MLFRALALLTLLVGLSVCLTLWFGQEVLIAIGLVLTQSKVILKKLAALELPAVLAWIKAQGALFFRVELIKKWFSTTLVPLVLGNAVLRRVEAFAGRYRAAVRVQYQRLIRWYAALGRPEQIATALVVLAAFLALTVSSLGLWLILFSVKLPFWIAAVLAASGRMVVSSIERMAFRTLAFLQLTWAWKLVRWMLPDHVLERKRRFDFRVARMVVRRRRMTLRQLESGRNSLSLRLSLIAEYFRAQPVHRPYTKDTQSKASKEVQGEG
ncbi:MAG: hypothetical protein AAF566_10900 [Pseudomonadota bacterium]